MTKAKPRIFCIGTNHKLADIAFRESLYIEKQDLLASLSLTQKRFGFSELAVLSTCNRFEMFGVLPDAPGAAPNLIEAYLDLQSHKKRASNVDSITIEQKSYTFFGTDAVKHIFSVASSLDSLVVGETQITGQFKDAIAIARQSQTIGTTIGRLAQEALATSKKIRSKTSIGERTVSISHAAIDLAKRVFGHIDQHKFLIIGAGEMAEIAAKYAVQYNPNGVYIANRSIANAQKLVADLGSGSPHSLDELPRLLIEADIIISSTGANHLVIDYEMVSRAVNRRSGRPLFLVDIALPRDIESRCSELDDVYLFEIDDLQQMVNENLGERQQAADSALLIVNDATIQFERWLDSFSTKPVLAGFHDYLDDLIGREANRTFSREIYSGLSQDQYQGIQSMMTAIKSKINSDAAKIINNPPDGFFKEDLAEALRTIFQLSLDSKD